MRSTPSVQLPQVQPSGSGSASMVADSSPVSRSRLALKSAKTSSWLTPLPSSAPASMSVTSAIEA